MAETAKAAAATAETAAIRCPLCGSRFNEGEGSACIYCRRRAGCGMVACPRCGHEFPRIVPRSPGVRDRTSTAMGAARADDPGSEYRPSGDAG